MSGKNQTPTTHVIFDYVGTICDINQMIEKIGRVYFQSIGKDIPATYNGDYCNLYFNLPFFCSS